MRNKLLYNCDDLMELNVLYTDKEMTMRARDRGITGVDGRPYGKSAFSSAARASIERKDGYFERIKDERGDVFTRRIRSGVNYLAISLERGKKEKSQNKRKMGFPKPGPLSQELYWEGRLLA